MEKPYSEELQRRMYSLHSSHNMEKFTYQQRSSRKQSWS